MYALVDYTCKLIPAAISVGINWDLSENGVARIFRL